MNATDEVRHLMVFEAWGCLATSVLDSVWQLNSSDLVLRQCLRQDRRSVDAGLLKLPVSC
jgi:hypothetical protein